MPLYPSPYDDLFTPQSLDQIFNAYIKSRQMQMAGENQAIGQAGKGVMPKQTYGLDPKDLQGLTDDYKRKRDKDLAGHGDQAGGFVNDPVTGVRLYSAGHGKMLPLPGQTGGYRYSGGELEAVPGGPAAMKIEATLSQRQSAAQNAIASADRMLGTIEKAKSQIGGLTTGVASGLKGIPGTSARDLQATLRTIQANVGFDTLNAMRAASKTGGALGAISEHELEFLQSTISALDQAQSPDQLRNNLEQVASNFKRMRDMAQQDIGGQRAAQPSGGKPKSDPLGLFR